jgi:hypothetical protein
LKFILNYAGKKQNSDKIMNMKIFAILDKAKPNTTVVATIDRA